MHSKHHHKLMTRTKLMKMAGFSNKLLNMAMTGGFTSGGGYLGSKQGESVNRTLFGGIMSSAIKTCDYCVIDTHDKGCLNVTLPC